MIVERDRIQGSPEWFAAHAGVPGASSFGQILTSTGKRSDQRKKLIYRLAGEKLVGNRESGYSSADMQRGTLMEPQAREAFCFITGMEVEQVGFCYHDERRRWGCSPDGLIVGVRQGFEAKCPKLETHTEYLDRGKLPTTYFPQVQGSMAATDYDQWHFWSFYPEAPPFHLVVDRDEAWIALFREAVEELVDEVETVFERLR